MRVGFFPSLLVLFQGLKLVQGFFGIQKVGNPFEGQYTGLAWADLNNDGTPDLLVSAGKHWVDQSYVLMNLGTNEYGGIIFSDPLPIGPPGGYYQVDATRLSFLGYGHHGVLLAGGDCIKEEPNQFGSCHLRDITPAILLDVLVTQCSVYRPWKPCKLHWNVVWQDLKAGGDRNGAFSQELGDGIDPAIVLAGAGGVSVFEPPYRAWPTFQLSPQDKLPQTNDYINRATGLAVGRIGLDYVGFFVGTRTAFSAPPAPLIGVWKTGPSTYDWYSIGENNRYYGNPGRIEVQATNLIMVDLNGDGILDIVEANHVSKVDLREGYPVQQDFYLLDEEGFPIHGTPVSFTWEYGGGRSLDAGNIFPDSFGPDIALGTGDGDVILFVNLGNSWDGKFLGLEERHRIATVEGCEVRDVKIIPSFSIPCAASVVAVAYCDGDYARGGVFAFHDFSTTCPEPTGTPTSTPNSRPTSLPTSAPSSATKTSVPTLMPSVLPTKAPRKAPFQHTTTYTPTQSPVAEVLSENLRHGSLGIASIQDDRDAQAEPTSSSTLPSTISSGILSVVGLFLLYVY